MEAVHASREISLFLNSKVDGKKFSEKILVEAHSPIFIGTKNADSKQRFVGEIEEVKLYNSTQKSEIGDSIVGHWNLNRMEHDQIVDLSSSHSNQGILVTHWKHLELGEWKPCMFWVEEGQSWSVEEKIPGKVTINASNIDLCKWVDLSGSNTRKVTLCGRTLSSSRSQNAEVKISADFKYIDDSLLLDNHINFNSIHWVDKWSGLQCITVHTPKEVNSALVTISVKSEPQFTASFTDISLVPGEAENYLSTCSDCLRTYSAVPYRYLKLLSPVH